MLHFLSVQHLHDQRQQLVALEARLFLEILQRRKVALQLLLDVVVHAGPQLGDLLAHLEHLDAADVDGVGAVLEELIGHAGGEHVTLAQVLLDVFGQPRVGELELLVHVANEVLNVGELVLGGEDAALLEHASHVTDLGLLLHLLHLELLGELLSEVEHVLGVAGIATALLLALEEPHGAVHGHGHLHIVIVLHVHLLHHIVEHLLEEVLLHGGLHPVVGMMGHAAVLGVVSRVDDGAGDAVRRLEDGQVEFGGGKSGALGKGLLELDHHLFGVGLAEAGLAGLVHGPLFEHVHLLVSGVNRDDGGEQERKQKDLHC